MTETNIINREPTKLDYASPIQFRFKMTKIPKVEFFVQTANIPGINLGTAVVPSPLYDYPVPGDKIQFQTLDLSFLVDENLENYRELHDWITAIAFPESREQFKSFREKNADRRPDSATVSPTKSDSPKPRTPDSAMYSDATLTILSNKNNPVVNVLFNNVYPASLSGLDYTNEGSDTEYLKATATFQYQLYKFESLKT